MKPDLILHIGHGKTGSTSIQRSLQRSPRALADQGMLYADADGHANHQEIFNHLTNAPKAPNYPGGPSPQQRAANSARLWQALTQQIADQAPKTVILSDENQFRPFAPPVFERMNALLRPLFDRITVVAYLRAPAPYFLSAVQQDLKKRSSFELPSASRFRDTLEPWRDNGPGPVSALRFARDSLRGGSVVQDFVTRFLPGLDPATLTPATETENVSVSAEAMDVLQSYFRGEIAAPHRFYARRPQRYKVLVREVDAVIPGGTKPRLHDGLAEVIDARCTDLGWLADTFGITFPEITASALGRDEAEARHAALSRVSDVCAVDPRRRDALLSAIGTTAMREQRPMNQLRRLLSGRI